MPGLDTRSAVFNLIMLNLLVFLAVTFLPININGMDFRSLLSLYYPASPFFLPHQLLTHQLTHANFTHLFFNMFNLYMFGTMLERVWGQKRLLFFFFATGIGGALLYVLANGFQLYQLCGTFMPSTELMLHNTRVAEMANSSCLGASGAVFGLLAAAGLLFGESEVYIYGVFPVRIKILVLFMIAAEIYMQFQNNPGDNIAHLAHLTGAFVGFVIVKVWNKNRTNFF